MCGFGMDLIFKVAIGIIVILAILGILRFAFGEWYTWLTGGEYAGIIRIVVGAVIAIVILLFVWRLAECAGVVGHYGVLTPAIGLA